MKLRITFIAILVVALMAGVAFAGGGHHYDGTVTNGTITWTYENPVDDKDGHWVKTTLKTATFNINGKESCVELMTWRELLDYDDPDVKTKLETYVGDIDLPNCMFLIYKPYFPALEESGKLIFKLKTIYAEGKEGTATTTGLRFYAELLCGSLPVPGDEGTYFVHISGAAAFGTGQISEKKQVVETTLKPQTVSFNGPVQGIVIECHDKAVFKMGMNVKFNLARDED